MIIPKLRWYWTILDVFVVLEVDVFALLLVPVWKSVELVQAMSCCGLLQSHIFFSLCRTCSALGLDVRDGSRSILVESHPLHGRGPLEQFFCHCKPQIPCLSPRWSSIFDKFSSSIQHSLLSGHVMSYELCLSLTFSLRLRWLRAYIRSKWLWLLPSLSKPNPWTEIEAVEVEACEGNAFPTQKSAQKSFFV